MINLEELDFPQHFAITKILEERDRQNGKWGEQNHNPFIWLAILQEEVGELAKEILELDDLNYDQTKLEEEAVQTAAVATAFIECLQRDRWSW